jgi:hypothetical protein
MIGDNLLNIVYFKMGFKNIFKRLKLESKSIFIVSPPSIPPQGGKDILQISSYRLGIEICELLKVFSLNPRA